MPRPKCLRRICHVPGITYFKPAGVPLGVLEEVVVPLDEVEAIRLADLYGAYHEEAAERMRISRPTFSRLIGAAHKKIADALLHGKAIRMEGGPITMDGGDRMPARDTPGPADAWPGRGMGPCGCGQAGRARRGRRGAGPGWRGTGGSARGAGAEKKPERMEEADARLPRDTTKGGAE